MQGQIPQCQVRAPDGHCPCGEQGPQLCLLLVLRPRWLLLGSQPHTGPLGAGERYCLVALGDFEEAEEGKDDGGSGLLLSTCSRLKYLFVLLIEVMPSSAQGFYFWFCAWTTPWWASVGLRGPYGVGIPVSEIIF